MYVCNKMWSNHVQIHVISGIKSCHIFQHILCKKWTKYTWDCFITNVVVFFTTAYLSTVPTLTVPINPPPPPFFFWGGGEWFYHVFLFLLKSVYTCTLRIGNSGISLFLCVQMSTSQSLILQSWTSYYYFDDYCNDIGVYIGISIIL